MMDGDASTPLGDPPVAIIPQQQRKVIVVLEKASLEVARMSPKHYDSKLQLLSCDEHQSILKRLGRDIADARPDIVHQVSNLGESRLLWNWPTDR
jgi:rRNA small subunit pseudouridine methyltransferase Nep1